MSTADRPALPHTSARDAPETLAVLLREPFRAGTAVLHRRFAERGHPDIRAPHGNAMQFLDDDGTRVSVLAERAQMTKQSMAELVGHLERLGYVERVPDPSDRRAKLVRATPRGRELYAIAREVVAEVEAEWTRRLGRAKMRRLRLLLEELNAAL
ncbi:MAG TPA: MarR family transcriptional regulator [Solirubrobacteraceae bacterium]|jgi:DNA-binding MarR family transcriptional regulator|nr:MarR family transcriptional regulator [Solirubrobacteraceae bacterium]